MNRARSEILSAIRAVTDQATAKDIAQKSVELVSNPDDLRPAVDDIKARFVAKATSKRVTATVSEITDLTELPKAMIQYLDSLGLPHRIAMQPCPALIRLKWKGFDIHSDTASDELVGLSLAEAAVAETGSVLVRSGPEAPFLLNFLPLHHVVVVPCQNILRHIEDAFAFVGTRQIDQPRVQALITGTSGTADIEAKNIRGAHGPRYMHLILCNALRL